MKVAIPTIDGVLSPHFGHSQEFTLVDVDLEKKEIKRVSREVPPPHEPGVLPRWLKELGCDIVIAGGMGQRAVAFFEQSGIQVITGAPVQKADEVVQAYLASRLATGGNLCDDDDFRAGGHTDCRGHKRKIR